MTKMIALLLFCHYALALMAFALMFVCLLFHAQDLVMETVAMSLMIALEIIFLRYLRWFINNRPAIHISPEGITQSGYFSIGTIYWHEIAAIQESTFLLLPVVRLVPRDIESLRIRLGKRGKYLRRHRVSGGLAIASSGFDVPAREMVERIEQYRSRHTNFWDEEKI